MTDYGDEDDTAFYVTATCTVLLGHAEKAEHVFEDCGCSYDDKTLGLHTVRYSFEDTYTGDLPFTTELMDEGIAFDAYWERTGMPLRRRTSGRFDENGTQNIRVAEPHDDYMLHIDRLGELLGAAREVELHRLIQSVYDRTRPLSWENQEEYGKRHLLRRLIEQENVPDVEDIPF